MSDWIEAREPEGIVTVTLDDGFHLTTFPDKAQVENDHDFWIRLAEEERERYWTDRA